MKDYAIEAQLESDHPSETLERLERERLALIEHLRQTAPSGKKFDFGKVRLDLIPVDALWVVGEVYSMGARKYSDWNWANGLKYSRVIAALLRHLYKWMMGEMYDLQDHQHHLASVIWCGLTLLHYDLNKDLHQFDDRHTGYGEVWKHDSPCMKEST